MVRILLADDHTIFRQGLKELLANTEDLVVAEEAATGREAISRAREKDIDVVLLDISMPDIHGIDVLKSIRQARPDIPVIILSMHSEAEYGLRALKAHASAYLVKNCKAGDLLSAIRKVYSGQKYISPHLAELIAAKTYGHKGFAPHEILSDREYQILAMIASGKRIKDIAGILGLSPKTVSTYRHRLLGKLHMESNEDLCTYARNHGLLD